MESQRLSTSSGLRQQRLIVQEEQRAAGHDRLRIGGDQPPSRCRGASSDAIQMPARERSFDVTRNTTCRPSSRNDGHACAVSPAAAQRRQRRDRSIDRPFHQRAVGGGREHDVAGGVPGGAARRWRASAAIDTVPASRSRTRSWPPAKNPIRDRVRGPERRRGLIGARQRAGFAGAQIVQPERHHPGLGRGVDEPAAIRGQRESK